MKVTGIIAEYNPFHNGHAWQITEARRRTGCDYIVVVMSGDFVQRGAPAITDKFTRTKMALSGGADLVLELPVHYSCSSAEYFARGAVTLLSRLGCVDTLCFGCETEEPEAFLRLSDILACEPEPFGQILRSFLAKGLSFPRARMRALLEIQPETELPGSAVAALLTSPNNMLGLEYMAACRRMGYTMNFLPVLRRGVGHHDRKAQQEFASASAIRECPQDAAAYMPKQSFLYFDDAIKQGMIRRTEDFSALLHYALMSSPDYNLYLDVNATLADRIRSKLDQYQSIGQFVSLLKTKNMTEARIRRCLMHILLNIRSEFFAKNALCGLSYARVLGFCQSAAPLLSQIKKEGQIPLLSRASDGKKMLSGTELQAFLQNLHTSRIYHILDGSVYDEYRLPPVILP